LCASDPELWASVQERIPENDDDSEIESASTGESAGAPQDLPPYAIDKASSRTQPAPAGSCSESEEDEASFEQPVGEGDDDDDGL